MKIVKPKRATRCYTQHLVAAPNAVFPLLCPVREAEWIRGWDPSLVVSASGAGTEADVTYTHTSLGPRGDEFVTSFTEEFYRAFMQDWESRINHFLVHGEAC